MARGTRLHHWKVRLIETLEYKLLFYMQLGMRLEYCILSTLQEMREHLHWLGSEIQLCSLQSSIATVYPGGVSSWGRHCRGHRPHCGAGGGTKSSSGGDTGQHGGRGGA